MPPVSWLRALGDERSKDVLRSVAVGYLNEPDSLDLLFDQVCRMRAHNADADAETDEGADGDVETDHDDAEASQTCAEDTDAREKQPGREAADGEIPEAPPRLKEQTALQNAGYCTFPSCNRTARKADFDHMSPQRGPGGRTCLVTAGSTTRLDQHGRQHRRRRTNAA